MSAKRRKRIGLALASSAVALLAWAAPVLGAEIPLDKHGLPMWEIKAWRDFPVRIELSGPEELHDLLARVPIASFAREQVRPTGGPKSERLIFEPRITEEEAAALAAAGYSFVRLEDLDRQGREEAERIWAEQAKAGGDLLQLGQKGVYHTHAQIGDLLAQVETDHPDIARDLVYGTSVQGRELWGIVISDNVHSDEAEPEIRLSSTMHGDEPPGMEMLLYLVDYLTDNYGQPGYEDVTNLVDNYEIHILPLHNPDGYVADTRYNANGEDLNRNFPVPDGSIGDDLTYDEEPEVIAYETYASGKHFVLGENGHAGALVVNYPWDYTYTLAPDNDALIQMSLEFSTYNLPMYNGAFSRGITNGAAWYVVQGSLQDWAYHETGSFDVTIECSNTKWPAASALDGLWDDNRESYMRFIKSARYGINGVVTASDTGLPLAATVAFSTNENPTTTDPANGDYYKLLDTGTYDVTFTAPGYTTETHYDVSTTWGTPAVLNVDLDPVASGVVSGVVTGGGSGLDADIVVRAHPTGQYVTTTHSSAAAGGAYSVELYYGDYEFWVSSPGYLQNDWVVTVLAPTVTADFNLSAAQEVDLLSCSFEDGLDGWTGDWGLAGEGHASTDAMTDSPGGDYERYADSVSQTGVLDLSEALEGTLTFWAKWSIEANWDGCFLQVSTDGGTSWQSLATGYTQPGSGQGAQQPAGVPVFEGSQASWVENSVDLEPYLGQSDVRFRFRLASDSSVQYDGFYCDDFLVRMVREAVSGVLAQAPERRPLTAWPNPFNPRTTIGFALLRPAHVQLGVYDLQGALVRTLLAEPLPAGPHEIVWDGTDDGGRSLASGVYMARLAAGNVHQLQKLVLLK
jgi:hypothetical protein